MQNDTTFSDLSLFKNVTSSSSQGQYCIYLAPRLRTVLTAKSQKFAPSTKQSKPVNRL